MTVRTRSAGDIIDASCTRCRILTNHTIVAMVEGRIVRVKCNTCGSEHRYHQPKDGKGSPDRRPSGAGVRAPSSVQVKKETPPPSRQLWEEALAGKDSSSAREYAMADRFRKDEVIRHQLFGLGVVTVVTGTKMEVLFAEGPKLLRCGK